LCAAAQQQTKETPVASRFEMNDLQIIVATESVSGFHDPARCPHTLGTRASVVIAPR
jgi:hypothetical protein